MLISKLSWWWCLGVDFGQSFLSSELYLIYNANGNFWDPTVEGINTLISYCHSGFAKRPLCFSSWSTSFSPTGTWVFAVFQQLTTLVSEEAFWRAVDLFPWQKCTYTSVLLYLKQPSDVRSSHTVTVKCLSLTTARNCSYTAFPQAPFFPFCGTWRSC